MKILGIRPPEVELTLEGYRGTAGPISVVPKRARAPCLNIFYVGAVIQQELGKVGEKAHLCFEDMAAKRPDNTYPYLSEFVKNSPMEYGSGTIRKMLRGENFEALEEKVRTADICFMSAPYTAGAIAVAQTTTFIKKFNPKTLVFLGGRDAQYRPKWYLDHGADVIFLGQAENIAGKVILDFFRKGSSDSLGIATRDKPNGEVLSRNADLSEEIFPAFDSNLIPLYTESCDGPMPPQAPSPLMWYFTSVGCPRSCDFCPTATTKYSSLSPERVKRLLEHYKANNIRTLLSAEDNFLARFLEKNKSQLQAEQELTEIMRLIRSNGFGHEFSNGLEVGLLVDSKGDPRTNLIGELFSRGNSEGHTTGTYRMYWPIETFTRREKFSKLKDKDTHYRILEAVLSTGIPEIVFNSIIFSDSSPDEITSFRNELRKFCNWMHTHQGKTKWSIPLFHQLPLPGARNYTSLLGRSFDINTHPELWAVPINPLNGKHFSYSQLYSLKRELMQEFDPKCLASWDNVGRYESSIHNTPLSET